MTASTSAPPLTAEEALLSLTVAETREERFAAFSALVSTRGHLRRPIALDGVVALPGHVGGAGTGLLGGAPVPGRPGWSLSMAARGGFVMRRHEAADTGTASPTGWQEVSSW
ncbi:hypothetical protein [Cellulomonas iranensis]|uniref:hypothetical protein n=1 Tax=Cellulomonas iranensis TaxID=76862 RepID=UPI001177E482|nr:hypothetical protein [Cellulomonas iranensis]